jgi:hypothetical protein
MAAVLQSAHARAETVTGSTARFVPRRPTPTKLLETPVTGTS